MSRRNRNRDHKSVPDDGPPKQEAPIPPGQAGWAVRRVPMSQGMQWAVGVGLVVLAAIAGTRSGGCNSADAPVDPSRKSGGMTPGPRGPDPGDTTKIVTPAKTVAGDPFPEGFTGPGETLRVAAWNIEWLGRPDRRSGPAKNNAQQPADLADVMADTGAAVIGLSEITDDSAGGPPSNSTITAALKVLQDKHGGDWRHVLFAKPGGERDQCTGVAWDAKRVALVAGPTPLAIAEEIGPVGETLWKRPATAVKFSAGKGRTDINVIVVHMKSNFGDREKPGAPAAQRALEAERLLAALPKLDGPWAGEKDVLIIGDTNCKSAAEPAIVALVKAGFRDLNAADAPTHHSPGSGFEPAPFDRVFVPADQPEFAGAVQITTRGAFEKARGVSERNFKIRYSDHSPVAVDVKVMADDD